MIEGIENTCSFVQQTNKMEKLLPSRLQYADVLLNNYEIFSIHRLQLIMFISNMLWQWAVADCLITYTIKLNSFHQCAQKSFNKFFERLTNTKRWTEWTDFDSNVCKCSCWMVERQLWLHVKWKPTTTIEGK